MHFNPIINKVWFRFHLSTWTWNLPIKIYVRSTAFSENPSILCSDVNKCNLQDGTILPRNDSNPACGNTLLMTLLVVQKSIWTHAKRLSNHQRNEPGGWRGTSRRLKSLPFPVKESITWECGCVFVSNFNPTQNKIKHVPNRVVHQNLKARKSAPSTWACVYVKRLEDASKLFPKKKKGKDVKFLVTLPTCHSFAAPVSLQVSY